MAKKRRRRRRLESKYIARRLVVMAIPLVIIVGVVYLILRPSGETAGDAASGSSGVSGVSGDGVDDVENLAAAAGSKPEPEPEPRKPDVDTGDWNLLLVNGSNPLPKSFDVELENIGDYRVDTRIADNIRRMFTKAKSDGINLMLCSAYRSYEKQEELFEGRKQDYLAKGMSEEDAVAATLNYTTRPGTSEHHTGLAVDIVTPNYQNLDEGFADTAAAQWLFENAETFGFVLRYPKSKESVTQVSYEPWHYRYVGEEHAKAMNELGYCLEEYLYVALRDEAEREAKALEPTADEDAQEA